MSDGSPRLIALIDGEEVPIVREVGGWFATFRDGSRVRVELTDADYEKIASPQPSFSMSFVRVEVEE